MSDDGEKGVRARPDGRVKRTEGLHLRSLAAPLLLCGGLNTVTAFTDAGAIAGLAGLMSTQLADGVVSDSLMDTLAEPPVVVGLVLATLLLNTISVAVMHRVASNWEAQRRSELIDAYSAADLRTQRSYSGSGLAVLGEQIPRAGSAVTALVGFSSGMVRISIFFAIGLTVSWQVSLATVVSGVVLLFLVRFISRRTRKINTHLAAETSELGEEIGELASSARELHLLNRWGEMGDSVKSQVHRIRTLRFEGNFLSGMVGPLYGSGIILVGTVVVLLASRTGAGISELATAGLLLIRTLGSAQNSQVVYQQYNDSLPFVHRVHRILGELSAAGRNFSVETLDHQVTTIGTDHLSLSHGNDDVVREVTLRLSGPGGIGIVGPSGAGKSTLLVALAGQLAPAAGSVQAGPVSVTDLAGPELGRRIGLLPQDPRVLRTSVRSNLLRPEVEVGDDRIWEVLERVRLDETVRGFAGGLDARVGRAAEGFSGGELQRLGLARLVLNDPDVWLLDEPTSALDTSNSRVVYDVVAEAVRDRLVVIVTHRPELLTLCDQIVLMESGKVIDHGPSDEMKQRHPFISTMHGLEPESVSGDGAVDRA